MEFGRIKPTVWTEVFEGRRGGLARQRQSSLQTGVLPAPVLWALGPGLLPSVQVQSHQRVEMQISHAQGLFQLHSKMRQGHPKDKAMDSPKQTSLTQCMLMDEMHSPKSSYQVNWISNCQVGHPTFFYYCIV